MCSISLQRFPYLQIQSFNTKTAQSIPSNFDFSERQSCELPWVNFNAADDAREKAIAECRALSLEDRMPSFARSKGSPMSVGKPSGRDDLTHIFHFNKTDCMIHRKTASRVAAPRSMGHALIKLQAPPSSLSNSRITRRCVTANEACVRTPKSAADRLPAACVRNRRARCGFEHGYTMGANPYGRAPHQRVLCALPTNACRGFPMKNTAPRALLS